MSVYALQKLIRDVNRKPACREAFFQSAEAFSESYELTAPEREALAAAAIRSPAQEPVRLRAAAVGEHALARSRSVHRLV